MNPALKLPLPKLPLPKLPAPQPSASKPPAPRLLPASFPVSHPAAPAWGVSGLLGCLVEISGSAASGVLSSALELVAEAQRDEALQTKGPVVWVASTRSLFFPPDAASSGVALERLILLRLGTPAAQIRAATRIAHSGGFGLVVVDLADSVQPQVSGWGAGRSKTPAAVPPLSRLAGFVRKHRSVLVLLTEKAPAAPSLDPRVVKRYDASRKGGGVVITVIKDKGGGSGLGPPERPSGLPDRSAVRRPPGFRFERECREPAGMC